AAVDVLERGAGKPAHDRVVGAAGGFLYRGEIALGGDGKAGLDDVDAHLIEQLGDFELLLVGHGGARALFAVAQGGVKDNDAVLLGLRWRSHDVGPSRRLRPCLGRSWVPCSRSPECPGAKRPAGPQGTIRSRSPPRMRAPPVRPLAFRVIAQ